MILDAQRQVLVGIGGPQQLSFADKIRWSNDKAQGVFVNVGLTRKSDVLNKIGIRQEL